MNEQYRQLLEAARAAAKAGRAVLRSKWESNLTVEAKALHDFVTDADRESEAAILQNLTGAFPESSALAEESAQTIEKPGPQSGLVWIVDPLDGTSNFIHRIPHVAISIAAYVDGRPAAGVVLDVTRGEEFSALAGGGAFLDGKPMGVSPSVERDRWLLATGFPWRRQEILGQYLGLFQEVFEGTGGARRAGAAALDMAYVAAGRVEGFFELGLSPWDLAAGDLLVREAGGLVSDFAGGDRAVWTGNVAAGSPACQPWLQKACARHFPKA